MNEKEHKNGLTLSFEENILFFFKYYLRRNNRNYLSSIKQKQREMVGWQSYTESIQEIR